MRHIDQESCSYTCACLQPGLRYMHKCEKCRRFLTGFPVLCLWELLALYPADVIPCEILDLTWSQLESGRQGFSINPFSTSLVVITSPS